MQTHERSVFASRLPCSIRKTQRPAYVPQRYADQAAHARYAVVQCRCGRECAETSTNKIGLSGPRVDGESQRLGGECAADLCQRHGGTRSGAADDTDPGEPCGPRARWTVVNCSRAIENIGYAVAANQGASLKRLSARHLGNRFLAKEI